MLSDLIDELANEHDFVVERLEYGPGLGVPYFMDDDFSDDLLPIREIADDLRALAAKTELTIEMGRFFASPCGTYFTKAMDLKSNKGTNYAILDGGMHHITYFGQMMGMHVPPIVNLTREAEDRESEVAEWCLCGSLCTVNDVLVRAVELDSLQRGDVLAFGRCGAYAVTEGVSLFLSRRLPRVLLREADGSVVLARDFIESSQFNGLAVG
jgi:diaminopimelate decarboxylase